MARRYLRRKKRMDRSGQIWKKTIYPTCGRNPSEAALKAGHGGGDYFEIMDFIQSINGEIACPIGIHEAMDMTLPGLISQQSIVQDGAWLYVPDSRSWIEE